MKELLLLLFFFLFQPTPEQYAKARDVYRNATAYDTWRVGQLVVTRSYYGSGAVSVYGPAGYERRLWIQDGHWFLIDLSTPWDGKNVEIVRGKPDHP